jgi:carboxyl-terminal processing protease
MRGPAYPQLASPERRSPARRAPEGSRWRRRAASLVALALLVLAAPAARAELALTCERVPELLRTYLQKHIRYHYLNEDLRNRAVDVYLERIDPSKTLLLRDEATALRAKLISIFHEMRQGDCSSLHALQSDLLARYRAMEKEVRTFVGREDYEIDPSVTIVADSDKRARPVTAEDRTRLLHDLVHFQMANYVNAGFELAEAKSKLVHRYELMSKRIAERDKEDVYADFLDSFATSLDPHSNYLSPDDLEDFNIGMGLSLQGIGVALSSIDGYSVVKEIIEGGAAWKLDVLEPEDKIIAVAQEDGEWVDVVDMDLRDVVRLIRGKRGTKVHLKVLRTDEKKERFVVSIVRDKIDLNDKAAALRFENVEVGDQTYKLAVLELTSFYGGRNPGDRQSSTDVRRLLEKVRKAKADGLLFDLSRNGGGLLENSVEIAGLFVPDGGVVAVKNSFANVQTVDDPDPSIVYDGPLVVLTSRVSASASEIVAGALKDYQRAILVGDDYTFGKGTVQSMVPLPTGLGALKVTTALYFRPGGKSTQSEGVPADIVLPSVFATDDFGERHQENSLPGEEIDPFLETPENGKRSLPWRPVTAEVVSELARRSAERVAASEEFAEIRKQLAEARDDDGVMSLAEVLTEHEESQNGSKPDASEEAAAEEEEEKPSPQQREALAILADYVALLD